MKAVVSSKGILCGVALAFLAGCQTVPDTRAISTTPVVPRADEQIIRDQLIILVDASGSIGSAREFAYEKELVQAFTAAMPDGAYEAGIDSFGGVPTDEWLEKPLAPFNRGAMVDAASNLEPLGKLTPLARALQNQKAELAGKRGRGALLVFSDGKVRIPEAVLEACHELKAAHGGDLCIYTVQVGTSERGRALLHQMVAAAGCGDYYNAASLDSEAAIHTLVRDIFFGPGAVSRAPRTPEAWPLRVINFANDSSVIETRYNAELDELATILKNNPDMRILLEGHTDSNASDAYNQRLSQRRVQAVREALLARGVNAAQLETRAYGENRPAVPNTTPDNLRRNRRVELSVID